MKKFTLLLSGLICIIASLNAQISLTYHQHALMPDQENPMVITKYSDPGAGGAYQIWDFGSLKYLKDFKGNVNQASYSNHMIDFPEANVELTEFNNHFYFNLTRSQLEQTGYANKNGTVLIKYDQPFVKMKYPFTFGNQYSGNYSGTYKIGERMANIRGTYSVESDGHGKLILPNGQVLRNTLRVKEVKKYDRNFDSRTDNIKIVTYRWYNDAERFPLLVLTEITTNNKHVSHQAAYRTNIKSKSGMLSEDSHKQYNTSIFPNPVNEEFRVNYALNTDSRVVIELYDNTGRKIANLVDLQQNSGEYEFGFKASDYNLSRGNYILKASLGDHTETLQLIKAE